MKYDQMISQRSEIRQGGLRLRFERKFLVRDMKSFQIEKMILLNKAGFIEKFHTRKINNIYFDTPNFDFYSASVRGYSPRRKIRIRWYGDMFGMIDNAVLEIKHKEGIVNYKSSWALGNLDLTQGSDMIGQINKSINRSALPINLISEIKSLKPSLVNQYQRKYYESKRCNIRLTLDNDLIFFGINRFMNHYLNKTSEHNLSVLELKYSIIADDIVNNITAQFPCQLTKCSKYVLGVNRIYLFSDLS